MRTIHLTGSTPSGSLIPGDAAKPQPGRGELLIRVGAAGVITAELEWYPTTHRQDGGVRKGAVPCHEFAGVVDAAGEDVGSLEIGRAVFGMNDWYAQGAMADYCLAPFFAVAPKPSRLSFEEAASVPISALTAWQALFEHAKLQPGERVLVQGGAGGVGLFAIQFARLRGAYVIATASARNQEFVSSLGADQVIDYQKSPFEDHAGQTDVVFDTAGGETLERSWSVLKPGGRLVTVASSAADSTDPRVKRAFFIVEPNQKQLVEIAGLLDAGKLRTVIDAVVPLSRAPEVYSGRVPRQSRGKVVITVENMV